MLLLFTDSSYVDDESAQADETRGEAARKTVKILMSRKPATRIGQPSPGKPIMSKKTRTVLNNAIEVQSEEEGTQPFAVSKSAVLQAKKDAEKKKRDAIAAESEKIFGFNKADSRLSETKQKSTPNSKASSESDSDSITELKILSPKKSSARKSSKPETPASSSDDDKHKVTTRSKSYGASFKKSNGREALKPETRASSSDDDNEVLTRSKSQSASPKKSNSRKASKPETPASSSDDDKQEVTTRSKSQDNKSRFSLRSSPKKSHQAAPKSTNADASPMSKKLLQSPKRSSRSTQKLSLKSTKKSVSEQSSGDSDLEILSPQKPNSSSSVKRQTDLNLDTSNDDDRNQAKKRKANDDSDSESDSVLFKTNSTPQKTTPKASVSSKRTIVGQKDANKKSEVNSTTEISRSPVRSSPRKTQRNLTAQKEGDSSNIDPEGTKVFTKLGNPSMVSKEIAKKPKSFDLSDDDDSDKAPKVEPKRLKRPALRKANTMSQFLDSDDTNSSESDETFSLYKKKKLQKTSNRKSAPSTKEQRDELSEEEVDGIRGVQKMIEHLQSTSTDKVKENTKPRRQTRSLLKMLDLNITPEEQPMGE